MKPLFVNRSRMWLAVLSVGVLLVSAGLFQLTAGFYGIRDSLRGEAPVVETPVNKGKAAEPKAEKPAAPEEQSRKEARQNEFFAEYRLERDRTRSQQIDLYREIVNNQNSAEETRKEAQRRLLAISQAIDTEMKLENLIKAENFKDAVVFVQEKSATVIVQAPLLTPIDKNKITDIAVRVTGLNAESIAVIAKM